MVPCRGTSVGQTVVCLINLNDLIPGCARQLGGVLGQSCLIGPYRSPMFNRVKRCFVSQGKITVFVVMTSVHCGSFSITVNVVGIFF